MVADFSTGFQTIDVCTLVYTPIYAIQGSGLSAAITGNTTTQGVVVGDFEGSTGLQGFYLQDESGDGDPATSDGIFVFTGSANLVSAGEVVRVTGFARERFNQTALNGSNSNSSAVPAANIVNCGTGSLAPTDVMMPFADANYPERFEGMLVRLPQDLVISEYFNYDRFGEIVLALPLDGESRPFTGTAIDEPGTAANARALANSLSRITLDDAVSTQNPAALRHPNGGAFGLDNRFRGGDTVQNTVGVLGYDFNLYRIVPTGPANYTAANPRTPAPEPVGGNLRVAAMNTLNYFLTLDPLDDPTNPDNPADNICGPTGNKQDCRGADLSQPDEFARQRAKLIAALAGLDADVIGLNELENTTGVEPLDDIITALNEQLGPGTYAYINTGTIGTDAIKVGLIYRPAKVAPVGAYQILDSTDDPRFLDTKNRPVLAQTFEDPVNGGRFTVAVNHLKSKGSDCNDISDPDVGDGQGNCNQTRLAAAQALVDWLATDPTGSGDPDFLIMGDLNSYAQEDPIDAVKAGADDIAGTADDYTNLIAQFQGTYAYSYVFDGQAGYLDQALGSSSLISQVTGAADWHINADEPDLLDYDTSFKPAAQEAIYEPNAYRSSDHDPVVVGLCQPPSLKVSLSPDTLWSANHKYVNVQATFEASANTSTILLLSVTSNEPDNGDDDGDTIDDIVINDNSNFDLRAERSGIGTGRIYTITYQATNTCGSSTIETATVTVPLSQGN
jgi:predicted extracellular nuclease